MVGRGSMSLQDEKPALDDSGSAWLAGVGHEGSKGLHLELSHARADLLDPNNDSNRSAMTMTFATARYVWYWWGDRDTRQYCPWFPDRPTRGRLNALSTMMLNMVTVNPYSIQAGSSIETHCTLITSMGITSGRRRCHVLRHGPFVSPLTRVSAWVIFGRL